MARRNCGWRSSDVHRRLVRRRGAGGLSRQEDRLSTVLLIILVVLILGALPHWPYAANWGYYPSSGLVLILVLLIVFLLATGRPLWVY